MLCLYDSIPPCSHSSSSCDPHSLSDSWDLLYCYMHTYIHTNIFTYKYSLLSPFRVHMCICLGLTIWAWIAYGALVPGEDSFFTSTAINCLRIGVRSCKMSPIHFGILYRSCLGKPYFEISWLQLPCDTYKTTSQQMPWTSGSYGLSTVPLWCSWILRCCSCAADVSIVVGPHGPWFLHFDYLWFL